MFVRNYIVDGDYRHSRLAWSKDYEKTWTWADWHFSGTFGCPEFVQFGPNYKGARDAYVYVVSQANDDAYEYSPDVVMARVPKDKVRDRNAYQFFAGLDAKGKPAWSADISDSKALLHGRAWRDANFDHLQSGSQAVYHDCFPSRGRRAA